MHGQGLFNVACRSQSIGRVDFDTFGDFDEILTLLVKFIQNVNDVVVPLLRATDGYRPVTGRLHQLLS